jgi:hypothetical protein
MAGVLLAELIALRLVRVLGQRARTSVARVLKTALLLARLVVSRPARVSVLRRRRAAVARVRTLGRLAGWAAAARVPGPTAMGLLISRLGGSVRRCGGF